MRWIAHLEAGLAGLHVGARRVGNQVCALGPEIVVGPVEHLDTIQHLDPVGRIPARHDQAQRKAVEQRQLLAVQAVGESSPPRRRAAWSSRHATS